MTMTRTNRAATGMALASFILAGWIALHGLAVFTADIAALPGWLILLTVLTICWLNVGLFIVAHDCMHGSLAPGRPRVNWWMGQACVGLYAGFSYERLLANHMLHHRHSGTDEDPDFSHPRPFWGWYADFMAEYMSWRQTVFMAAQGITYVAVLGVDWRNALVFWVVPAMLSSMQLFVFGTYLPHRPSAQGFADRHNARSNEYPPWLSLITCFHFGYHHEHHLRPGEPWWRLPAVRTERRS
jgi:beta-carotene/zeaxanthin 4-ketolase